LLVFVGIGAMISGLNEAWRRAITGLAQSEDRLQATLAAIGDAAIDRKHAEERFRLTVEAAPAAMIMGDRRGTIVLVNRLTQRLFGYAREELVGQSIDRLVTRTAEPADRLRSGDASRQLRTAPHPQGNQYLYLSDL